MTYHDLARKLHENPFKPFRIKLVNNSTYDVLEPWMITIGRSSAIVVTRSETEEGGYHVALDWRTISIAHILEFMDIDRKERDRKKKPA
jgi:hypothetical protein